MFLFFSLARSAQAGQAERADEAQTTVTGAVDPAVTAGIDPAEVAERMPTDKLVDVSPLALRMSSPFNAGYWLSAA